MTKKNRYIWAVLVLAIQSQVVAAELLLKPSPQQKEAAAWAARILERYRYKAEGPVQRGGEQTFDAYIKALDENRMIFTKADIAAMEPFRSKLDEVTGGSELDIPFAIFDSYQARLAEWLGYAKSVLHRPLDFAGTERFQRVRAQAPFADSDDALRDLWRKRVMDDYLSLRLAGCIEQDIIPTLERRYDKYFKALTGGDVFPLFMNAYAHTRDPHASYFPPITPSKSTGFASIGLVVQKKGDQIVVLEQAPGGPAERSSQLGPGDRIVGIAQGVDQPMTDLVGASVDEAIALLRGVAGSTVVLDILPANAPLDAVRKRVALERTIWDPRSLIQNVVRAHVEVVAHPGASYRIGVIVIPTFYQDFAARRTGAKDFTSVSRDVAAQLQVLKSAKVDAVLLDLRNNGGGPLDEATRLAGLFVPGVPVAQQRQHDGKISVETSPGDVSHWDGVLGVLINKGSAAATELFAGAIQDYSRGLVIGDVSVGRGSVQTIIALDRFATTKQAGFGDLKMTVGQLFRVDGMPLQRGVTPDIPTSDVADVAGTSARDKAFEELPIKATDFKKHGELAALLPTLSARHATRTLHDAGYQAMLSARAEEEARRIKDDVSLNQSERRKVRDARVSVDAAKVQLDEALHILGDEIELLRANANLAKRVGIVPAAPP